MEMSLMIQRTPKKLALRRDHAMEWRDAEHASPTLFQTSRYACKSIEQVVVEMIGCWTTGRENILRFVGEV
jgi:hypothetical protein